MIFSTPFAATGHFDQANAIARDTLQLAEGFANTNLAAQVKARLKSYGQYSNAPRSGAGPQ